MADSMRARACMAAGGAMGFQKQTHGPALECARRVGAPGEATYTTVVTLRRMLCCLLVALAAMPAGCAGGRVAKENDRLRAQAVELKKQLDELSLRNAELRAELWRVSAAADSLPQEIRANTPHVAQITIGRYSHACDEDGDGRADTLVLYLKPVDGLGRPLQMVGHLSVHAATLPPEADAVTVGRVALSPGEVRDAYRSSFAGAHYTVTVPISLPAQTEEGACIVSVEYLDGLTGQRYISERAMELTVEPSPRRPQP